MAHAISLDVAFHEDSLDQALTELTSGLDVEHEVVTHAGPAGGWPVVRFTSNDRRQLDTMIVRYAGDNEADRFHLRQQIVEI